MVGPHQAYHSKLGGLLGCHTDSTKVWQMRPVEQLAVWRIQLLRQASNFCADSRELMSCKIRDSKQEQHGVSQVIHAWSLDRVAGLDHCTCHKHLSLLPIYWLVLLS